MTNLARVASYVFRSDVVNEKLNTVSLYHDVVLVALLQAHIFFVFVPRYFRAGKTAHLAIQPSHEAEVAVGVSDGPLKVRRDFFRKQKLLNVVSK